MGKKKDNYNGKEQDPCIGFFFHTNEQRNEIIKLQEDSLI